MTNSLRSRLRSATWDEAARRWGTRPLAELLRPAAKLAADGFVVDQQFRGQTVENAERFSWFPATAALYGRWLAAAETSRRGGGRGGGWGGGLSGGSVAAQWRLSGGLRPLAATEAVGFRRTRWVKGSRPWMCRPTNSWRSPIRRSPACGAIRHRRPVSGGRTR